MAFINSTGKFSPLKIPGCALWLEADRGITLVDGLVSAWADQSGNGRHASQTTEGYRPAYVTNQFNGYPALLLDGTDDCFTVPALGTTSVVTTVAVRKVTRVSGEEGVLYSIELATDVVIGEFMGDGYAGTGNKLVWATTTGCTPIKTVSVMDITNPHISTLQYDGVNRELTSSWVYRLDGAAQSLNGASSSFGIASSVQGYIGRYPTTTNNYKGYLVVLVVYKRLITATEIRLIELHYSRKYGIALA